MKPERIIRVRLSDTQIAEFSACQRHGKRPDPSLRIPEMIDGLRPVLLRRKFEHAVEVRMRNGGSSEPPPRNH
jgi:hypothetical protein